MILTATTVLALAGACQGVVAPATILKIAWAESSLDSTARHVNPDHSVDLGLTQINSKNLAWLGLTETDALDPCKNIHAAAALLSSFSRYNSGSPTRSLGYALRVQGVQTATGEAAPAATPACPEPDPAGWHIAASIVGCAPQNPDWHIIKGVP